MAVSVNEEAGVRLWILIWRNKVYEYYRTSVAQGIKITSKMIKDKAIELSTNENFMASKGWLDKYKNRYNLKLSKDHFKKPSIAYIKVQGEQ